MLKNNLVLYFFNWKIRNHRTEKYGSSIKFYLRQKLIIFIDLPLLKLKFIICFIVAFVVCYNSQDNQTFICYLSGDRCYEQMDNRSMMR